MSKTLILSLGRTGSLPMYAENIAKNFNNINYTLILSKNRTNKVEYPNAIEVTTYYNKITFVFNTIFYLPILILSFVPKIYKQYDTLYLPYKHFWDIPFILIFKLFRKKILFTVHDGVLHHGEKNFFTQHLNNIRLKQSTELVFLTGYVNNVVKEELGIVKKSIIIPHPIIENKYVNFNDKKENTKNILFFGRIDKYKGVELLMEAAMLIKKEFDCLIIAGKSLYEINYILDSKIEIKDLYLSEKEIGDLLTWADVLVLPYTEATQSGVIALGIYAETPMVCTNVGGFNEQLNVDECFWCEPTKEDLSRVLIESLINHDKRKKIQGKLKEKKHQLSWKNVSRMVETKIINNG